MDYKDHGSTTKDADCQCQDGFHFENEDQRACVPNRECGKGYGQGDYGKIHMTIVEEDWRVWYVCDCVWMCPWVSVCVCVCVRVPTSVLHVNLRVFSGCVATSAKDIVILVSQETIKTSVWVSAVWHWPLLLIESRDLEIPRVPHHSPFSLALSPSSPPASPCVWLV